MKVWITWSDGWGGQGFKGNNSRVRRFTGLREIVSFALQVLQTRSPMNAPPATLLMRVRIQRLASWMALRCSLR